MSLWHCHVGNELPLFAYAQEEFCYLYNYFPAYPPEKKSGSASNYVCFYLFDTSFHLCLAPYLFGVTSYRGQILLDNSVLCFILRWLKEKRKLNIFVEPRVKLELLNESSYYNFVQTWQDGKVLHLDFCIVEY